MKASEWDAPILSLEDEIDNPWKEEGLFVSSPDRQTLFKQLCFVVAQTPEWSEGVSREDAPRLQELFMAFIEQGEEGDVAPVVTDSMQEEFNASPVTPFACLVARRLGVNENIVPGTVYRDWKAAEPKELFWWWGEHGDPKETLKAAAKRLDKRWWEVVARYAQWRYASAWRQRDAAARKLIALLDHFGEDMELEEEEADDEEEEEEEEEEVQIIPTTPSTPAKKKRGRPPKMYPSILDILDGDSATKRRRSRNRRPSFTAEEDARILEHAGRDGAEPTRYKYWDLVASKFPGKTRMQLCFRWKDLNEKGRSIPHKKRVRSPSLPAEEEEIVAQLEDEPVFNNGDALESVTKYLQAKDRVQQVKVELDAVTTTERAAIGEHAAAIAQVMDAQHAVRTCETSIRHNADDVSSTTNEYLQYATFSRDLICATDDASKAKLESMIEIHSRLTALDEEGTRLKEQHITLRKELATRVAAAQALADKLGSVSEKQKQLEEAEKEAAAMHAHLQEYTVIAVANAYCMIKRQDQTRNEA
jgi:hypothetical protein